MPMYNSYIISSYLQYRTAQVNFAREALKRGDDVAARKFLRTALVLSFRRRTAKKDLRNGHQLERNFTSEAEREALDRYLFTHRKLWQVSLKKKTA